MRWAQQPPAALCRLRQCRRHHHSHLHFLRRARGCLFQIVVVVLAWLTGAAEWPGLRLYQSEHRHPSFAELDCLVACFAGRSTLSLWFALATLMRTRQQLLAPLWMPISSQAMRVAQHIRQMFRQRNSIQTQLLYWRLAERCRVA